MDIFLQKLLSKGAFIAPEWISLLVLIFSLVSLLVFYRYFGLSGLYVYICLAVCMANLQILHLTTYRFWPQPIPLGTVLFTTTFFANELITDHYGKEAALRGVWLSFYAYLFLSVSMLISLAHAPATMGEFSQFSDYSEQNFSALMKIFVPSLRILIASLAAFAMSQWFNVWFFSFLKKIAGSRFLWLRQSSSMFFASVVDHFVFVFLAFYCLTDVKYPHKILIDGCVIGSYIVRIIVIFLCVIAAWLTKGFFLENKGFFKEKEDTTL